ncbi:MAG TPA: hypothetical protein DD417_12880 [Elusimicrobia bacterium]|nr:hypothetical protein [Elusimicrobiota bacterium]
MSIWQRFTAVSISTVLFLLSPGFGTYHALAAAFVSQSATVQPGAGTVVPAVLPNLSVTGASGIGTLQNAGSLGLQSALPSVRLLSPVPQSGAAALSAAAAPIAAQSRGVSASPLASVRAALSASVSQVPGVARQGRGLSQISREVQSFLTAVGRVSDARPEAAHSLGANLDSVLGGGVSRRSAVSVEVPADGRFGAVRSRFGDSEGWVFARPGGDSIAEAVAAHNSQAVTPAPVQQEETPAPAPRRNSPFFPKLIAAGLAVLPAVFLGLPLLSAGSTLAGAAILAASAGLIALPFMNERSSKTVRVIPGILLMGLGATTLVTGILSGTGIVMGVLTTLGGWGLYRYGGDTEQGDRYDEEKVLSAFFGALGAIAGAGLVLAGPAGLLAAGAGVLPWVVKGLIWVSYPLAGLLLLHLPGWVGNGIEASFRTVFESVYGVHRVMSSARRDTVLYDRLMRFTKGWLDRSPWNAIWLSGVWIPVWINELANFAISAVAGLALGAAQTPAMFLWGAAHKLAPESKANKFLAAWNRFLFEYAQGSKTSVFNRFEKPLAVYANSTNKLVSWSAGAGIRLLQLGWLAYALAAFPVLAAVGFFRAFGRTGEAYDAAKHSPRSLRYNKDDRPDVEKPEEPDQPGTPKKDTIIPRLIAAAIALAPLYFFGLPLAMVPAAGWAYIGAGLSLAAMPFMPAKTPKAIRQLPGYLLAAVGILSMTLLPYLTFAGTATALSFLGSNAFWMGLVTTLSGWGLIRYTGKAGATEKRWYSVDDPEYIGAFFGALGVLTGVGVGMLGLTGTLPLILKIGGYLTSPLLLMHLPGWLGRGLQSAGEGIGYSAKGYAEVFTFWREDTEFYKNLRHHARYWLGKSVWNASWLSVLWVPTWAAMLAEWVAAGILGLATGLLKAPLNFLWGAAYDVSPKSKATRFIAGFTRGMGRWGEGSKETRFDRAVRWLIPAMNEKHPVSGRPTLLAALATILMARLGQLYWLVSLALGLPYTLVISVLEGIQNMSGEPDPKDNPRIFY